MTRQRLTLERFLPYRLSVASNAVSDRIAAGYRGRFGLKIAEWRLIAILAEAGAMTQQALGARTRMDKIPVSRAATALVERGLVATARHPSDGRSHLLSLTPAGEALYAEIAPLALSLEQALLSGFTAQERAQLAGLLRRLEDAADAMGATGDGAAPVNEG
jgi:DNA-binding MarR family transcriptional regulator